MPSNINANGALGVTGGGHTKGSLTENTIELDVGGQVKGNATLQGGDGQISPTLSAFLLKKFTLEANERSKNIQKFLDPNRKKHKFKNKTGQKFVELMNFYSVNEIQEMVDKRFLEDPVVQKIYNEYNLKDAECVVDMGSGCGLFEGRGIKNLINLDKNPYPHVNLLNDMRCTQLKDNVADRIICLGSHLWIFGDRTFLNEIYRIAKPGCIMLSYCNSISVWKYLDKNNGLPYDKDRIVEWLHSKHKVVECQFIPKHDGNIIKTTPELNSHGHNRRVGISKDKIFWVWTL
jgi:SAM-dependent methyltransferase